jgi:hypothetical protein
MSSTIPLYPREQLCTRYCSNKQQQGGCQDPWVLAAVNSPYANSFIIGPAVRSNNKFRIVSEEEEGFEAKSDE